MTHTLIEQNRRLLEFYCTAARILGLSLLVLGSIGFLITLGHLTGFVGRELAVEPLLGIFERSWLTIILAGLVTSFVAQFIRYLYDREYQPSCLLRHGHQILYLYAIFIVFSKVYFYVYSLKSPSQSYLCNPIVSGILFFWLPLSLLTLAKVLILVGLGQVLRRIMPVIEEFKTLV